MFENEEKTMKKVLLCLGVCLCCVVGVFSEEISSEKSKESFFSITTLLDEGLKKNKVEIMNESMFLTDFDRYSLYESHKNSAIGPFFLNLCLGFGIGSFVQGDNLGGGITLALDIVGSGFVTYGIIQMVPFLFSLPLSPFLVQDETSNESFSNLAENSSFGSIMLAVGGGVIAISRIVQVILPWTYASNFNKNLEEALGVEAVGFNIAPAINIATNTPQFTASVSIRL